MRKVIVKGLKFCFMACISILAFITLVICLERGNGAGALFIWILSGMIGFAFLGIPFKGWNFAKTGGLGVCLSFGLLSLLVSVANFTKKD